jgi:L-fuculose-phosphate aldolase
MTLNENTIKQFQLAGKELNQRQLISSHAGNLSALNGDKIMITKTGSMAGWLEENDIIEVNLNDMDSDLEKYASTEIIVHREIYKATESKAVIHSHNPYCTTLSLILNEINCIDLEGKIFLKNIPVIDCKNPTASPELATKVSTVLVDHPVVIVKSHGVFSRGESLIEALKFTTGAEQSAEIIYRLVLLGKH